MDDLTGGGASFMLGQITAQVQEINHRLDRMIRYQEDTEKQREAEFNAFVEKYEKEHKLLLGRLAVQEQNEKYVKLGGRALRYLGIVLVAFIIWLKTGDWAAVKAIFNP